VVLPVTDEFSWRNQGMGHEDLVRSVTEIVHNARATSLRISVTLSVAFGCPFAGEVPESVVISLAQRFANLGVHELAIADTIGVADPRAVSSLVRRMEGAIPLPALRVHFHDTRNTGIANVYAAFEAGVRVFDASVSGAGGCPFAPAASGNVATEDLAYLFHRMGVSTGLDHDAILETAVWLAERLGRPPQSALTRAGWFPSPS
jgi:isopropylmalate/homocitrate/citramalate synthase